MLQALRAEAGRMDVEHRVSIELVCLVSNILHRGKDLLPGSCWRSRWGRAGEALLARRIESA